MRNTPRSLAVLALKALTLLTLLDSFGQSYRGLLDLALHHADIPQPFATFFPLMVDAFMAYGELWLYIATADSAPRSRSVLGWAMTAIGAAGSVIGNIGHVGITADWSVRIWAAVPPMAAIAGLVAWLGLVRLGRAAGTAVLPVFPDPLDGLVSTVHQPPVKTGSTAPKTGKTTAVRVKSGRGRRRDVWLSEPRVVEALAGIRDALGQGDKVTHRGAAGRWDITKHEAGVLIGIAQNGDGS